MEHRAVLWSLVVIYAAAIFILSSSSSPPTDGDLGLSIPFFDKMGHFVIYFIFGYLIYRASDEDRKGPYFAYSVGAIYAFSDEMHQYFVPNRSADPFDFIVDALAIFLAIWISMREKPIKGQ